MSRLLYDSQKYHEERAKLPKPDGEHCIICKIAFDKPNKNKFYCSRECYLNWYKSLEIRSWSDVRDDVLMRDGKCLECGIELVKLNYHISFEVHHIVPICEGGEEFNHDNCITLCQDCHKKVHSKTGNRKRINKSLLEYP